MFANSCRGTDQHRHVINTDTTTQCKQNVYSPAYFSWAEHIPIQCS